MNTNLNDKILVVEYDEVVLGLLYEFFNGLGYCIIVTNYSNDALKLALSEVPDLILINLSYENSLEIIYKIRQKEELADIPILISSDSGSRGIRLYANIDKFGNALIGYITKPINFNKLRDQIDLILSNKKKAA